MRCKRKKSGCKVGGGDELYDVATMAIIHHGGKAGSRNRPDAR